MLQSVLLNQFVALSALTRTGGTKNHNILHIFLLFSYFDITLFRHFGMTTFRYDDFRHSETSVYRSFKPRPCWS
jgi:hypothetical protein